VRSHTSTHKIDETIIAAKRSTNERQSAISYKYQFKLDCIGSDTCTSATQESKLWQNGMNRTAAAKHNIIHAIAKFDAAKHNARAIYHFGE